jgi:hypothetical protein
MTNLIDQYSAQIEHFIAQSKADKQIWGLRAEDGWLSCESEHQPKEVMPFWSSQDKASAHVIDEWSDFEVIEIPLDIFVEDWLLTFDEEDVLIALDWDEQLEGAEMPAAQLASLYK